MAVTNTTLAAAICGLTWTLLSVATKKHVNAVDVLNGMVAGLAGM